jgi:hypothetical protein
MSVMKKLLLATCSIPWKINITNCTNENNSYVSLAVDFPRSRHPKSWRGFFHALFSYTVLHNMVCPPTPLLFLPSSLLPQFCNKRSLNKNNNNNKSKMPLTASERRQLLLQPNTTCLALGLDGPALCQKCIVQSDALLGYTRKSKLLCCEQPWKEDKRCHFYACKRKAYIDSWKYLEDIGYAPRDVTCPSGYTKNSKTSRPPPQGPVAKKMKRTPNSKDPPATTMKHDEKLVRNERNDNDKTASKVKDPLAMPYDNGILHDKLVQGILHDKLVQAFESFLGKELESLGKEERDSLVIKLNAAFQQSSATHESSLSDVSMDSSSSSLERENLLLIRKNVALAHQVDYLQSRLEGDRNNSTEGVHGNDVSTAGNVLEGDGNNSTEGVHGNDVSTGGWECVGR